MSGPRLKQYTARVEGVTYSFNGLVELMAKATPLRSGDELAGCAASSRDAERAAAAVGARRPAAGRVPRGVVSPTRTTKSPG